jgi:hypothetical protein
MKDEGGNDEVKALKPLQHSFHPSSLPPSSLLSARVSNNLSAS